MYAHEKFTLECETLHIPQYRMYFLDENYKYTQVRSYSEETIKINHEADYFNECIYVITFYYGGRGFTT